MREYIFNRDFNFIISSILICLSLSCTDPVHAPIVDEYSKNISVVILSPAENSKISGTTKIDIQVISKKPISDISLFVDEKVVLLDTAIVKTIKSDTTYYELILNSYFWADDSLHNLKTLVSDNSGAKQISQVVGVYIKSSYSGMLQLLYPVDNEFVRNTDQVNFSWKKVDQATKYEIQIAKSYLFDLLEQSMTTMDTFYISSKLQQKPFFWRVRANVQDAQWGSWSQPSLFIIDGPQSPMRNYPLANDVVYPPAIFSWHHSEYAKDYEIQIFKTSAPYSIVSSAVISDTFMMSTLPFGKYFWKIRARNEVGLWGSWSDSLLIANGIFARQLSATSMSSNFRILEKADNGFIILLGNSIIGIDKTGVVEWTKSFTTFDALDIEASTNGNYLLVGNPNNSLTVAQISSTGNTINTKILSDTSEAFSRSIKRTSDGGFIIAATYCDCIVGSITYRRPVLYKIDKDLNLQWKSTISDKVVSSISANETSDNGFVYLGNILSDPVKQTAIYIKTNSTGNVLWEKTPATWDDPGDGAGTTDNGFIGIGWSRSGAFWQKINASGNEDWKKNYSFFPSYAASITEFDGDNYLIAGSGTNSSNKNIFLIKINNLGIVEWEKKYIGFQAYSVIRTTDGGICILVRGNNGLKVIKTDNYGETFE